MLTVAILDREDFMAWIAGRALDQPLWLDPAALKGMLRPGKSAVVWDTDRGLSGASQAIISIPQSEMQDFFAFVTTYVSGLVPLTAFFRVVPAEQLEFFLAAPRRTEGNVPRHFIGVCIAEAFLRMEGRAKSLDEIPLAAIGATLSSALLSGLAAGMLGGRIGLIAKRWAATRELLGDREPPFYLTSIVEIFEALSGLGDSSSDAKSDLVWQTEVVRAVMSTGIVDRQDWNHLVQGRSDLSQIFELMKGPREDRTKQFRSSIQMLKSAFLPEKRGMAECCAGCLLALVGDGSFQYLPLCREFGEEIPGATLWFGLWSSLLKTSDVLSGGSSLGRRAARDILIPVEPFAVPKDDVSYDELRVLGFDAHGVPNFRSAQQTSISVELVPGISAKFRTRNVPKPEDDRNRNISPADVSELRFLLERAEKVVDRMEQSTGRDGPKTGSEVIKARRRR